MTTFQRTLIVVVIATSIGVAILESWEASALRGQNQALRLQREELATQLQEAEQARERIDAQVSILHSQKERVDKIPSELLRLRGEVGLLRQTAATLSNELHRALSYGEVQHARTPSPYLGTLELSASTPSQFDIDASNNCTIKTTVLPDGRLLLDMTIATRGSDQAPTPLEMIVTNDQQVSFQSEHMSAPVSFKTRLKSE